ncbi:MAG: hypothetical protein ACRDHW_08215 [Ktedonobacteraceae bacterium]
MNQLNETYAVVDDIFTVFENVRSMFRAWDKSKHMPFIQQVMKLQVLEVKLYKLGYDEDFVRLLVKAVYESVFTRTEIQQYAGT